MNCYSAVGNLGADCRTNSVKGTAVCNFTVAVKSGFGQSEQTLWLDCALWGKRAEKGVVDYLKKGQKVAVTGELGTREHEGKTYLTLRLNDVTLCGDKGSVSATPQSQPPRNQQPAQAPGDFDDSDSIPF
jgi:single-strand DNA-binding protein